MNPDEETLQRVLLKTLGLLMIAVGISMLSNLWAHERPEEAIPAAFEEAFVAGSPSASPGPACLKKRRVPCGSGSCVRVSAPSAVVGVEAGLSESLNDERTSTFSEKPCRRLCCR